MQCSVHNIAAGPDGRCALCRASLRAGAPGEGARLGWILFLGLGTATAALLGWHSLRPRPTHAAPNTAPEPLAAAPIAAPPAPTPEAPILTEPVPAPSAFVQAAPRLAGTALASASASAPAPAPVASAPAPVASAPAPGPTPEQVQAALLATPIVMYSATWCSVCKQAEAFLRANGLSYRKRDIDLDPAARSELGQRTGGNTIPVFEIGGKLLRPGFSERSVERALVESVEQRLGVRGVRLETPSR